MGKFRSREGFRPKKQFYSLLDNSLNPGGLNPILEWLSGVSPFFKGFFPNRKLHYFRRIHGNPLENFLCQKTIGTPQGVLGEDPWDCCSLKNSLKVLFFKRFLPPWESWLDSPPVWESEGDSPLQHESSLIRVALVN